MGPDAMIFIFECWVLSQLFHSPLLLSSRGSLVLLCFLPQQWCHLHIWCYWYFSWQSWFQLVLHPARHFTWCTMHRSEISRVTIYSLDVQFSSVAQSCPTLCDPMNHSTPGFPVHHQLLEFTQTHVHRVGDAIQPSHLLSSPSPPAPNPSQNQGVFQWVNSSHEVAKVLEFQL